MEGRTMDFFPAAKEIKDAVGDLRTLIHNANAVVLEVHRLIVAFQEAAARTAPKELTALPKE
jgi:hypothetical protein